RRALEDAVALLLVQAGEIGRGVLRLGAAVLLGLDEAERDDAAGRRAGDQVEEVRDVRLGACLDLGENRRRDDAADAAAVDGEDLREVSHRRSSFVEPFGARRAGAAPAWWGAGRGRRLADARAAARR